MPPFLEVDHLPSSTSFYSAILQPLGLRYFSKEGSGPFPSVTFADLTNTPFLQLRQVISSRERPLRRSHLALSAPSADAAEDAYQFAKQAVLRHPSDPYAYPSGVASARRIEASSGGTRVLITDFVGNMLEIVYQPPPEYPPHYTGSTVRYTRSTSEEATRILTWNYDVATSSLPSPSSASEASVRTPTRRSYAPAPAYDDDYDEDDAPRPSFRRSVTTGTSSYAPAKSARENSNGLSAGAVVGTLLGVGAAAAMGAYAYNNMTKRDKGGRSYRGDDYDPPSFSRRSTYPEKYVDGYSDRKGRYVEVERTIERPRYPDEDDDDYYPTSSDYRRPPPEYIARYSEAPPRNRDLEDVYEVDLRGRRHASTRSRPSSGRTRSESTPYRDPYPGAEVVEHRTSYSSRSARHPPIVQRAYTYDTPDRDSYVSARSHRSSSTLRGAPAPPPPPVLDPYDSPSHHHSRSGSRVITTTTYKLTPTGAREAYSREGSYVSARHVPLPESRSPSYISAGHERERHRERERERELVYETVRAPSYGRSASYSTRHVPLPPSRVEEDEWEEEEDDGLPGDDDSIAPSDSISCVGAKRYR
ncbi:hypothetical protein VTJ04DRAFT_10644 [Mycothermus thermophilus]|uniref:uncharacterized protein n=1 Tax=Humicola insolens TaxID=85995 RepID=UPI0037433964